jgi:hypothetical protein
LSIFRALKTYSGFSGICFCTKNDFGKVENLILSYRAEPEGPTRTPTDPRRSGPVWPLSPSASSVHGGHSTPPPPPWRARHRLHPRPYLSCTATSPACPNRPASSSRARHHHPSTDTVKPSAAAGCRLIRCHRRPSSQASATRSFRISSCTSSAASRRGLATGAPSVHGDRPLPMHHRRPPLSEIRPPPSFSALR